MTHSTKPEQPDYFKQLEKDFNDHRCSIFTTETSAPVLSDFLFFKNKIQSLQSRIKELEQELLLKKDEAARYRHANCILLDDDRETALLNEVNRLQMREQELQKHNDQLICAAHDSELKAKELQQENERLKKQP
jgi:hypothetical protein